MIKKTFLSILLVSVALLTLLIGCSKVVRPEENVTSTSVIPSAQITSLGATEEIATLTPIADSVQIVSPTPTELVHYNATNPTLKEICPSIGNRPPDSDITTGKLLFVDYDHNKIMSLDPYTRAIKPFFPENEIALSYALSYDGKWLAYQSENDLTHEYRLSIVGADGREIISIPWEKQWIKISYWLDNEHVIIKSQGESFLDFLVLDPFSNERKKLSLKFPDIYTFDYPPDWNGAGPAIFNSPLTRVVYADSNQKYVLWNVETSKPLASIQTFLIQQPAGAPQWSLKGNQVIVAAPIRTLDYANYELFLINMDGEVERLTNLTDTYAIVGIDGYSWSPDGIHIAMLVSTESDSFIPQRLAILDRTNNTIELYCIQGDITMKYRINPQGDYNQISYTGVAWSPDGRQVMLENRIAENLSNLILIDIYKHLAYTLIENANVEPLGWIIGEP